MPWEGWGGEERRSTESRCRIKIVVAVAKLDYHAKVRVDDDERRKEKSE